MKADRSRMPGRVVPLRSAEAAEARVPGTIDERLALVSVLSARAWASTGRPIPRYRRDDMPVVLTRLADQR